MKCTATMIKVGAVLALVLVAAYFALPPPFQAFIAGIAPFLLLLICPLSMLVMMRGMNHDQKRSEATATSSEAQDPSSAREPADTLKA